MATANKTVTFNTAEKSVAVTTTRESYCQLFNSAEQTKLKENIPRYSVVSNAQLTLEVADEHTLANGKYSIIYGPYGTEEYTTGKEKAYVEHVFSILNGIESTGSYAGYPKQRTEGVNARFLGLKIRDVVLGTHTNIWIRNFKIDYSFTYPTYQINADIKSDGVTNTTPGRIVVVTDSGYTSFTLNSKFDVNQTSKKYGIKAEPYYGFRFSNWEDGDTSNTKTWTISDGNINSHTTQTSIQRAVFIRENYTISSPTVEGGEVTGTGSYSYEQNITITAVPSYGYHFVRWKEDGVTSASRSIKVTENKTYTPEFALNTYSITTAFSPENGGTITGAKTYTHGNKVELVAVPKAGYQLLGWKKNQSSNIVLNPLQRETQTIDNHEAYSYNKIVFNAKEAASYTAIFRKVYITYDSIFSLSKWVENGISSSGISEATIFPTEGAPEGFKLKALRNDGYSKQSLTIPVQKGMTYRFDCDIEGTNYEIFFFHCPTRYENSWNQRPSGSQYNVFNTQSGTFTALENYISIRCDSNTSGEEITFSNFRIYPEGENYKHFSNSVNAQVRSDEMTWSPPNPKRRGFTFLGWYTGPLGTGEKIFSKEDLNSEITRAFPLHDMVLYSHWENSSSTTFRVTFSMRNTIQVDQT